MQILTKIKAVALMLLSSLSFSFMQVAVHISSKNIPTMEQIFFRNVIGIAFCIISSKKEGPIFGRRENQKLLFGWSSCAVVSIFFGFMAVSIGEQAGVAIISHLAPFLVMILARWILKERIQKTQILSICIAFCGSLLVTLPSTGYEAKSLLMALVSAVCNAMAYIFVGLLKGKERPIVQTAHYSLLGIITAIPFLAADFVVPSPMDFGLLVLIGLSGVLGILLQNMSYDLAPVSEMSVYSYSGIVFSMVLGNVILGEKIPLLSALGGMIIIGAAVLVYGSTAGSLTRKHSQKDK